MRHLGYCFIQNASFGYFFCQNASSWRPVQPRCIIWVTSTRMRTLLVPSTKRVFASKAKDRRLTLHLLWKFLVSETSMKFSTIYLKKFSHNTQIICYIQNINWPCIIDRWTNIPGGPLVYGSYNDSAQFTSEDEQAKGFVLMSSYFENKANITAIEFVPMTAGQLVIEVYEKL